MKNWTCHLPIVALFVCLGCKNDSPRRLRPKNAGILLQWPENPYHYRPAAYSVPSVTSPIGSEYYL